MELCLHRREDGCHILDMNGMHMRCAIGKGGIRTDKREGDGATPTGRFRLRRIFFRADRLADQFRGALPEYLQTAIPIREDHGWSDDPADHANYNRLVTLPYQGSHERLRRDDGLYDLLVELGYNDDPPVPGLGSAIFLHVARPDYSGTEGCLALARDDLLHVLARTGSKGTGSRAEIIVPEALASVRETG